MENIYTRQYVNRILNREKKDELRIAFLGGSLSKGEMVKREDCFVSVFETQITHILGTKKMFLSSVMANQALFLPMVYLRCSHCLLRNRILFLSIML